MRRPAAILTACLALLARPALADDRPPFVDAADTVPGLAVEMRYATSRNFVGRPIAGYEAPRCLLTPQAAAALARAQARLASRGLGLKVFDCYRPRRAVADFVAWATDPADQRGKAAYYPAIDKGDLFRLGYIARRSAHSRGSTVDLTLVRRRDGSELDMGTPFELLRTGLGAGLAGGDAGAGRQPAPAPRRDDSRRLHALRAGMVAFHACAGALSRDRLRRPGALTALARRRASRWLDGRFRRTSNFSKSSY